MKFVFTLAFGASKNDRQILSNEMLLGQAIVRAKPIGATIITDNFVLGGQDSGVKIWRTLPVIFSITKYNSRQIL